MIDFIPRRDADVLAFTRNFAERIDADPQAYRITRETADQYLARQEEFAEAYAAVCGVGRGGVMAVARKNAARQALVRETRLLARQMRGSMQINPQTLTTLGLRPHKTHRTRIGPPTTQVVIDVLAVYGNIMRLRLRDRVHQARPGNAIAARVFWTVDGESDGPVGWNILEPTTSTRCHIRLPETLAEGTHVWLRAHWLNPRYEPGPMGPIVQTRVGLKIVHTIDEVGLTTMARVA